MDLISRSLFKFARLGCQCGTDCGGSMTYRQSA